MADRKRMKKLRLKRIESVKTQIEEHRHKIDTQMPKKDTTKAYWKKEIDEKFVKQLEEDNEYLEEH